MDTVTAADLAGTCGRLHAATGQDCLPSCTTVIVCVPTPTHPDGTPDLEPLTQATRTVANHLRSGQTVIIESTTHPGTTDGPLREILEEHGLTAGHDFALAYSPERIDPGNHDHRLTTTPKLVAGLTSRCRDRAAAFYRGLGIPVHLTRGLREAEAAKILENTQRQINIALVNEFAQLCHHLDIDVWDTLAAAATKPFGYTSYRPGPGVGGHCIPTDPMYLVHCAHQIGMTLRLATAAQDINDGMPSWIADRICKHLDNHATPVAGAEILLLGVTYKPDITDIRNTPAVPLANRLRDRGATVTFHDPHITHLNLGDVVLQRVPHLRDALSRAAVCVLLQRHTAYAHDHVLDPAQTLFDTTCPVSSGLTGFTL
ncbi:MAG: UDP-N-acetyl-D-glucosamine dehydrogenase [Actinomycetota bacterium]|nr:UDP-N-acetyl-D-glucosamine dehydrogenase [Actinomycetota bacterium]